MVQTVATIRATFTQFQDPQRFPDTTIQMWLDLAVLRLNPQAWGTFLDAGTGFFVAHFLTLNTLRKGAAQGVGVLNSKAVGPVSAGYDTSAATTPGAGHWNLSIYGAQYIELQNIVGMAVMQVNGPGIPDGGFFGGGFVF